MAIVQISRIQHRRGLQQDLPQLASGELGWSIDERRLYIGNGTIEEGAPTEGVTEIVTAPNLLDITSELLTYTFKGTDTGYTSITGVDALNPVERNLQSVLDERVSVKHFGAKGNGTDDDSPAVNRALQQIYVSTLPNHPPVRRRIYFPGGTYRLDSALAIPPNVTLEGDGKNSTILLGTTANSVIVSADSSFAINQPCSNISISSMTLRNSSTNPVISLLDTTNATINDCIISGNVSVSSAQSVRITNSTVTGAATTITLTSTSGFVSQNNYFPQSVAFPIVGLTGNNYSIGDSFGVTSVNGAGLYLGSAKTTTSANVPLSAGSNTITTLHNGGASLLYEIGSAGNFRSGILKYSRNGSGVVFEDEYSETGSGVSANLYVASSGVLSCSVSATAYIKYSVRQFV